MTTPLNSRLLDKLQEECAEVIQAVSKIRRFGPLNHHPDRATTNLEELVGELEDALAIVRALEYTQYFYPYHISEKNTEQKTRLLLKLQ